MSRTVNEGIKGVRHPLKIGDTFENCRGDICKVVEYISSAKIVVEFDDGVKYTYQTGALRKGQFRKPITKVEVGASFKTTSSGVCKVVAYRSCTEVDVMFDSGVVVTCAASALRKGNVQDPSIAIKAGDKFRTMFSEWTVTKYVNAFHIEVVSENGYATVTRAAEIQSGMVKDYLHKRIAGVGFLGVGEFCYLSHPRAYRKWADMLHRCYDDTRYGWERYGGRGVTVCEHWHNFQNFAKWIINLPEYVYEAYELDKDILVPGNLVYGPLTCCLVPTLINGTVTPTAPRTDLPVGVAKTSNYKNPYRARISKQGKMHNIGVYATIQEASDAYTREKIDYLESLAEAYKDRISDSAYFALKNWRLRDAA